LKDIFYNQIVIIANNVYISIDINHTFEDLYVSKSQPN